MFVQIFCFHGIGLAGVHGCKTTIQEAGETQPGDSQSFLALIDHPPSVWEDAEDKVSSNWTWPGVISLTAQRGDCHPVPLVVGFYPIKRPTAQCNC